MTLDDIPNCNNNTDLDNTENYNYVSDQSEFNRFVDDSFLTILDLPKCIRSFVRQKCGDVKTVSEKQLQLTIRNFEIPSISIPSQKKTFTGATRSESSKTISEYEDITIQFKLDNTLNNYNILYRWLQMLSEPSTGVQSDFGKVDYETTFTVLLLDEYEKPVGAYTFSGVFPVSLGSISLDYTTSDNVFIDFTFSFDFLSFEYNPNY